LAETEEAKQSLQERVRFERVISRLSAVSINLPHDQIDRKIDDGLHLVGEALNIDRIVFHELSEDSQFLRITHFFLKPGVQPPTSTHTSEVQPWFTKTLLSGEIIKLDRIDNLPEEAKLEKNFLLKQGVKSGLAIPLIVGKKPVGVLAFTTVFRERSWPDEVVKQLQLVSEVFGNALDRKQKEQKLGNAFSEIKKLKDRLEQENIYLREEIRMSQGHEKILGQSDAILKVLGQAEQVAQTGSSVLILGETGTGKELLAHMIHELSSRKNRQMIKVNCAALPATLIESELFGREKGAYTGAMTRQMGRFELAHGSTIFLDEVSELSPELQAKLLRVLQEGQFERLGSSKTITVDVRVIAAANQDVARLVKEHKFREDLYYRVNVFPITMPPLRERLKDIPLLVWAFIREFEGTIGKSIDSIPKKGMDALRAHSWPGNIRELRNVIERAMILCTGSTLSIDRLETEEPTTIKDMTMEELERKHVLDVLERTRWRVRGRKGAAEILGLKPSTLESRMNKLKISRPR
ncbi:MAG: GAF domain-containing protein, partial [Candidatus Aminicenantes bacterium]